MSVHSLNIQFRSYVLYINSWLSEIIIERCVTGTMSVTVFIFLILFSDVVLVD